jgi:diguanylate cyclase (GGDEF)-like protein/PAS domain S-box-containing protein
MNKFLISCLLTLRWFNTVDLAAGGLVVMLAMLPGLAVWASCAANAGGNAAGQWTQTLIGQIEASEADPHFNAIEVAVPAFDPSEMLVNRAAVAYRPSGNRLRELDSVHTKVLLATASVLVFGVVLVAGFWSILLGYRRQSTAAGLREVESARGNERRLQSLVQNASDVILICANTGCITYHTPAAENEWGYRGGALLGVPLLDIVHPEDQPTCLELWQKAAALPGSERRAELRLRDAANTWRDTELTLTNLLAEPAIAGLIATVRDITARKVFEQQLTQQAFYDVLTGLPNRALFRDRLSLAMDRASLRHGQVCLLLVELDNFKLINDSLGHQRGDVLLTEAAARLQSCIPINSTLARLGDDVFAILLHQNSGEADASVMTARVAEQFTRAFVLDDHEVVVTASVGIALSGANHEAAESLLRNADVAVHRAKLSGKGGHVMFEDRMHTDALARLELETELRHALERQEFRVYYQPIVRLRSGRVTEAEALVRWRHPTRGLVDPNDFIPVAEETGLIVPLGQWVLEQACRQAAIWQAEYPADPPLLMGVNLSPRQFQQADLLELVTRALGETGLPAGSLKLEITEGVAMRDTEATIKVLQSLKQLGVQIAIDDFGTGYSSLAYLRRLPLDVLKIDRSFVNGVGENHDGNVIVRAIISLAHSLNLTVTAEGIESDRQAALMRSWGCECGQGCYWSWPIDSAAFEAMLRENTDCTETVAAA